MKLLKILEAKQYDKKHKCLTPGAVYSTSIHDKTITITVKLPDDAEAPEDAKELEVDMHYALEQVLARLF